MNYLAHFLLSGEDSNLLAGNFMGDSVKGNPDAFNHKQYVLGLKLHRSIDDFTDNHLVYRSARRIFSKRFGLFSGIITDIYFDHILANYFQDYSAIALPEFSALIIDKLEGHRSIFPEKSAKFFHYMKQNNIPEEYVSQSFIKEVLKGLSYRSGNRCQMWLAETEFLENQTELSEMFRSFFPDLINHCKEFRFKYPD